MESTGAGIEGARRAMERICRPKAAAAFMKAGGTRAYLDRYWNVAFTAAWETYSRHAARRSRLYSKSSPSRGGSRRKKSKQLRRFLGLIGA
jgi:hypothetical protein